ncbi:DUF4019 domain-containing protein [uncultured Sphingomonas sp.]|uniref:DUF4019 domain-containing protein n=1 Tax=uncultured Sphingomonas sp. TaxID=158754 RepID=UPI00341AED07
MIAVRHGMLLALLPLCSGTAAVGQDLAGQKPGAEQARAVAAVRAPQGAAPARQDATTSLSNSADRWLSPNAFLNVANQISSQAAAGKAGAIYDEVSPILKARFTRDAFVADLQKKLSGKVVQRNWQSISQVMIADTPNAKGTAAGEYVMVGLLVLAKGEDRKNEVRTEVLSFFHEKSGAWLLADYQINKKTM